MGELQGIGKAIQILTSENAKATCRNATTTFFLQISTIKKSVGAKVREGAFQQLRSLARQFNSLQVARIAAEVRVGGHFDKVLVMIDKMIELLRKEEQDDIEHRDRCEA